MLDIRKYPFEGPSLNVKIWKKKVRTMQEVLTMVESHMLLEEKLNKNFSIPLLSRPTPIA